MTADLTRSQRVLVLGLGVSGAAAAAALARAGAAVVAVDAGTGDAVAARARDLAARGVDARVGVPPTPALLSGCELVVASPGIAEAHPVLEAALQRDVRVWSEPELAWRLNGGRTRLVGITGTNGKTTTTELVAACLGAPSAGNIGTPLVDVIDPAAGAPPPVVVAELSSFQLRFTEQLRCDVAALLNLAPDHLDWHGSLEAYAAAKARLWATQRPEDTLVVNVDDVGAGRVVEHHPPRGRVVEVTARPPDAGQVGIDRGQLVAHLDGAPTVVVHVEDLRLRGPHNLANACAAAAVSLACGADPGRIGQALRGFRTGPHRLEHVATWDGVAWVNDSKATNPHAAAAALASFDSVVWIGGGLAKGVSFDSLLPLLRERVRAAVTIGTAASELAALARRAGIAAHEVGDLESAVRAAAGLAVPGDTVLLAPACASMDQFRDYAHRGEVFRGLVRALAPASLVPDEGARWPAG